MAEKTAGQWVGTIVGAVAGYFTGGATWYAVAGSMASGASIGSAVGGMLYPPKGPHLEGPRLNDLSVQSARYGAVIPRVYGTAALLGNVFWIENNQIKETATTESQGGKGGGGGTETTSYSYSATFAVGLCEGEITGVRRIWVGAKLIYDASATDISTIIASNLSSPLFTLYKGTDTQLPDDRMQAALGVANAPAYRGLAYIVFKDFPLADHGNSMLGAQVKVEVITSGGYSSHLISNFSIPEDPSWYNTVFKNAGNQMDSDGFSNFIVAKNSYPLWIQTINEKIVSQVTLSGPSVYPITTAVMPLTTSLDELQYAFVTSNDYFAWGKKGSLSVLQVPGSTPNVFAEHGGVIYVSWSIGAANYLAKLDETIITSQLNVTPENPAVAVWGDFAVAAYRAIGTDPITIRVYEEIEVVGVKTLVQNDSYTLVLGGSDNFRVNGTEKSVYISHNHLYVVSGAASGAGVFIKITIIDLINKSFVGSYDISQSFTAITISERPNVRIIGDVIFYGQRNVGLSAYGLVHNAWQLNRGSSSSVNLSEIVEAECLLSRILDSSDIDVTALTQQVRGYRVASVAAIRAAIEPLQGAWPFDVLQSGYKIKFKPRGGSVVATIPASDLDARERSKAAGNALVIAREMDSIIPRRVVLKHMDVDREYDQGEQYAERLNTDAVNIQTVEMAIAMTSTEAAGMAELLLYLYWMERYDISFSLPPTYNGLEPADVITINTADASYQLRLTSVAYASDGRLECSAKYNSAAIYTPTALGESGQSTGQTITLSGSCSYALLDIPLMLDATDLPGFPVAMTGYLAGWSGGSLFRTNDLGQTWSNLQSFTAPGAVMGSASATIGAGRLDLIDTASVLPVYLTSGDLSSITEAQLLGGANHFAYGVDGRWEIIGAQNCILQGDGSYLLSKLLRGRFGSEWACGLHKSGDRVVLLDSNRLKFLTANLNSIGQSRTYRAITSGKSLSSDSDLDFAYNAVNLECLAPVYLNGSRHPATSDWSLTWLRRTRVGGEWRDYVDATLGETVEAYELEIYSSAAYTTLKRTITGLSSAAAAYTSAQQVTDFGSNQATLYVKVYQLSAVVGRGYPLTTSITR